MDRDEQMKASLAEAKGGKNLHETVRRMQGMAALLRRNLYNNYHLSEDEISALSYVAEAMQKDLRTLEQFFRAADRGPF